MEDTKRTVDSSIIELSSGEQITRRELLKRLGVGLASGVMFSFSLDPRVMAEELQLEAPDHEKVPLPPATAQKFKTVCQFCSVGCGYNVTVWSKNQTPKAQGGQQTQGAWTAPSMLAETVINGIDSYVTIVPDQECVVNKGDHSERGGANALTVFAPTAQTLTDTSHRVKKAMVRKNGQLVPVSLQAAVNLVADKLAEVYKAYGPSAIAGWIADHEAAENNYVAVKWMFSPKPIGLYDPSLGPVKGTPQRAIHNRAKDNSETPIFQDIFGSDQNFPYAYEDGEQAEVVVLAGVNGYDTGSTWYNRIYTGGAKLVVIDPRKTRPAVNAEERGGIFLQLKPNTDVVLVNSIMHHILSRGLEDSAFINKRVDPSSWNKLKATVMQSKYNPDRTEIVTGVPAAKVRAAAELIAKAKATLFLFEKGIIWSGEMNEAQVGVYADLALLTGNVGKAGGSVGRQGGHQDAVIYGVPNPIADGKQRPNVWDSIAQGKVKFLWIIDSNPALTTQNTNEFITNVKKNVDFVVINEIYPQETLEVTDVVFPAAAWGEWEYVRSNLERRLRLYAKFMDPPSPDVLPDWQIQALVMQAVGNRHHLVNPNEYDWKTSSDVWDELKKTADGRAMGLHYLSHDTLKHLGTNGIQWPVVQQSGKLQGTPRLYTDAFPTPSGKANMIPFDVTWTVDNPRAFVPGPIREDAKHPYILITGRFNALWQCGYTFRYIPLQVAQIPDIEVNIHPSDADKEGLQSGDWVQLSNDNGTVEGLVIISDMMQPGTVFAPFAYPGAPSINALIESRYRSPRNAAYFKNVQVSMKKIPPKHQYQTTFKSRN
ncbi:molybdopterin-dependent oxidoreductase [Alicyclobacillus curvatus]|nr:molybdopterin-dependent oxidoreductase [Alicyclobacillus curvatus]